MRFARVPTQEAEGAILAHSIRVEGGTFKKGRVLDAAAVAALRAAGQTTVVAARLEPDDVAEDDAAAALAGAVAGAGLRVGDAFTGRCNLFAERPGLLEIEVAVVDAINGVHEALTMATLAQRDAVAAGQLVATIKIIPFAAPRNALERCLALVREAGAVIAVAPFASRRAALIQTLLPGTKTTVLDKTARVVEQRLQALGSRVVREIRCAHDEDEVSAALAAVLADGAEIVLVAGASAIVDRRDVVPVAIEMAGGRVLHFGMPVDPGNLLLLARHGTTPVIGLPGCARSPKFNGLDPVLERLLAGVPVGARDIMAMGVGGLLKEMVGRPMPRAAAAAGATPSASRLPRVAAVVLAAGRSTRMGGVNKLLAEVGGRPMVVRVIEALAASQAAPIIVVTGFEHERVRAALAHLDVRCVHNPHHARGLSTSLAAGLGAVPEDADAALVCLGDMPKITPSDVNNLIAAFDPLEGRAICVPTYAGKRGNPVLWSRRFFTEMSAVRGDVGAKHLIGEYAEVVCEVAAASDSVLTDIDSPDALAGVE